MNAPNRPSREWIHKQLCRGSWYPELPETLQFALIEGSLIRSFVTGAHIVEQGRHPEGLYAVLDGQLALLRQLPGDREFLVTVAGAGYWFADPSVLLGEPMPHTVVTRTKARILLVPSATVTRIRDQSAVHANHFARLHARRFLTTVNAVADAAALPRELFLRQRLADLAGLMGTRENDQTIDIAISQSELALMIGVSRQTLNGYLSDLEAQGLLKVGYRTIHLHRKLLTAPPST